MQNMPELCSQPSCDVRSESVKFRKKEKCNQAASLTGEEFQTSGCSVSALSHHKICDLYVNM